MTMAHPIKNVILVGGSGNIGSVILSKLLVSPDFTTTILTRTSSIATFPSSPSLKIIKSDYSTASLISAFQGQDAVICVLGHAAFGDQFKLIDAAVTAGVKRFIPAEFGVNTINDNAISLFSGALDVKLNVLEHLKKQEDKGLTWTGVATGAFFDWGIGNDIYGFNINTHTATILDGGERPFSVTTLTQVSAAVLAVLSKPNDTINKYLYVHSFTVSQNQILAALEEAEGRKWELTERSSVEYGNEGKEMSSKGDFAGTLKLLNVCFLGEGFGSDYTKDTESGVANEKLGLPEETLQEEVRKIVATQPIAG